MNDPLEYVKVSRHLQSVGTATCDVSHLIMLADGFGSGSAAREQLMNAARDVLRHRALARRSRVVLAAQKPKKRGK